MFLFFSTPHKKHIKLEMKVVITQCPLVVKALNDDLKQTMVRASPGHGIRLFFGLVLKPRRTELSTILSMLG